MSAKTGGGSPEWTHIPVSEVALLNASYLPTTKPHVPAQTLAKEKARDAEEEVIRPFVG